MDRVHVEQAGDVYRRYWNAKTHRHHSDPRPECLQRSVQCARALGVNKWTITTPDQIRRVGERAPHARQFLWQWKAVVEETSQQVLELGPDHFLVREAQ